MFGDGLSFFLLLFGPNPRNMEVPGLGVKSELQPTASTTATATQDLSCVSDLHHSSWQHQIPHPLSKARVRTRILMDTCQIRFY